MSQSKSRITITQLANLVLGFGGMLVVVFLIILSQQFEIAWDGKPNFEITGQLGDFIGGLAGTIVSIGGTLLLYATLKSQTDFNQQTDEHNQRAAFESHFFQLLNFHQQNVSNTYYRKYTQHGNHEHTGRKAFQTMFKELEKCWSDMYTVALRLDRRLFQQEYLDKLSNQRKGEAEKLAYLDLAYCVFYYGVDQDGLRILKDLYKEKCDPNALLALLLLLSAKIKEKEHHDDSERSRHQKYKDQWNSIEHQQHFPAETIQELINYYSGKSIDPQKPKTEYGLLVLRTRGITKYYGGHQHRLSHYFRHLYQIFKYIDTSEAISWSQKYQYNRILRSQLSTYEQQLLFVNALTDMGAAWEYNTSDDKGLIRKYRILKNIPRGKLFNMEIEQLFPKYNAPFNPTEYN